MTGDSITIADISIAISLTMPTILDVSYEKYEKVSGKIETREKNLNLANFSLARSNPRSVRVENRRRQVSAGATNAARKNEAVLVNFHLKVQNLGNKNEFSPKSDENE